MPGYAFFCRLIHMPLPFAFNRVPSTNCAPHYQSIPFLKNPNRSYPRTTDGTWYQISSSTVLWQHIIKKQLTSKRKFPLRAQIRNWDFSEKRLKTKSKTSYLYTFQASQSHAPVRPTPFSYWHTDQMKLKHAFKIPKPLQQTLFGVILASSWNLISYDIRICCSAQEQCKMA